MVKLRACLGLCIASVLAGSVTAVSAAKTSESVLATKGSGATDHITGFDGPMTTLTGPDGRTWAAWSYRASHELDIAISFRDENSTTWSAPVFFGRHSGSDELDPALAIDSRGAVYVAFATSNPSRVALSTLGAGSTTWSEPIIVSGSDAASAPALLLVGERVVVAYRTERGVGQVSLPTIGSGNQIEGLQDGPGPVTPSGKGVLPIRPSGPVPAISSSSHP
jgi:hypothetical protein